MDPTPWLGVDEVESGAFFNTVIEAQEDRVKAQERRQRRG